MQRHKTVTHELPIRDHERLLYQQVWSLDETSAAPKVWQAVGKARSTTLSYAYSSLNPVAIHPTATASLFPRQTFPLLLDEGMLA